MLLKYLTLLYRIALVFVGVTVATKWVKPNGTAILTAAGLWLIGHLVSSQWRDKFKNYRDPLLLGGALYLMYGIALLYSSNLRGGLLDMETKFTLVVFPLMIGTFCSIDKKTYNWILGAFAATCVLVSLVCFIFIFYTNYSKGIVYTHATNWMFSSDNFVERWGFHPSYLSMYGAFSVFIIIYFIANKKLNIFFGILLIAFLVLVSMMLASRVGTLALIFVGVSTIMYEMKKRGKLVYGIAIGGVLCAITFIALFSFGTMRDKMDALFNTNVHEFNAGFSSTARLTAWKVSWDIFIEHPFGVGPGDTKALLSDAYRVIGFKQGYDESYDSHSLIFDTLLCVGIPGLILLAVLMYTSVRRAIRSGNVLYMQFLTFFILLSIVESTFSVQKGVVFFSFFNSIFYFFSQPQASDATLNASNNKH